MSSNFLPKKFCRGLDQSPGILEFSKYSLPQVIKFSPESPFRFRFFEDDLFHKARRPLSASVNRASSFPGVPLGGSFIRGYRNSFPSASTERQTLSRSYRFNKSLICCTLDDKEDICISIDSFGGSFLEGHEFVAVDSLHLFDLDFLVITVYRHATNTTKAILYELLAKRYTILPFSEAGYISHMSASLLSDSTKHMTIIPRSDISKPFTAEFILAHGLDSSISAHIVSVGFSRAGGIIFKNDLPFSYKSSSCSKLATVKSWVMPGSNHLLIGYGTTNGRFQLLSYLILTPGHPPYLLKEFSHSLVKYASTSHALTAAPITWLDLKFMEDANFLLVVGQGSTIHGPSQISFKPSFSLIHIQPNLVNSSMLYSCQASGADSGAFIAASLTRVGSELHLAFSYWQSRLAPLVKVHHLTLYWPKKSLDERQKEAFSLSESDIPLDFHSNHLDFKLISSNYTKTFSACPLAPQNEAKVYSFNAQYFFLETCSRILSGDCLKPLVLADMLFLRNFLTTPPPRELTLPPKDTNAAKQIATFISSHAISAEFTNILFCYCLAYLNKEDAEAFASRFLSTQKLRLVTGYSMVDRGLMNQGMYYISLSNMPVHFPCELLDLILRSGNHKEAAQLWNYFRIRQPAPVVKDPAGLVESLLHIGIAEAHDFLNSYHDGVISRKAAFKAFYVAALGDAHIASFLRSSLAFNLKPEEEGYLREFLKSDGLNRDVLANGLHFFVGYLFGLQRYADTIIFFQAAEESIRAVCSPTQNERILKQADLAKSYNFNFEARQSRLGLMNALPSLNPSSESIGSASPSLPISPPSSFANQQVSDAKLWPLFTLPGELQK